MTDDKNNIVNVCLFETYLAKYLVEHPEHFKLLIDKFLASVEEVIQLNADNVMFQRMLFAVFSTLSQFDPSLTDMDSLKKSGSLIAMDTFIKYFAEQILAQSYTKKPSGVNVERHAPSFFSDAASCPKNILAIMRPPMLFTDRHRGVEDSDTSESDDVEETHRFGILAEQDTPEDLKQYFDSTHEPSRQFYKARESGFTSQWLREHGLPVISGLSGGIGKTAYQFSLITDLTKKEYQLLGLLVASSTIALGHHSFFEVMRPVCFLTGEPTEQESLIEFYEQVLPEDIIQSASYQAFRESDYGVSLISGINSQMHP